MSADATYRSSWRSSCQAQPEVAATPQSLEVMDESDQHAGHGGWREGETTHVRVRIVSAAFAGKSRVEVHRMMNALLAQEFAAGLHALAIEARAG
jgi:BolA family transcriptional regulator, general stress-responsive regulator